MEEISVGDIKIEVHRKDIKNIHLAVYPPSGRVRIATPFATDNDTLRLFAIAKLGWIKRNQRDFKSQERLSPRVYKERESHYFLGHRYLLKIVVENKPPKVTIKNKRYLELRIRPGTDTEKRHQILTEWYRKELKKIIPALISKWEEILRVKVESWQVKRMKTKWGSCNIEKRRIWLNLELAKKPIRSIEYIVVHEMVHLLERHHNERFQYYLDTHLPNWKQLKKELNDLPVEWDG